MKKSILLLTTIVSLILAGCSSPASTPVDNSAELKNLQAQLKTLQHNLMKYQKLHQKKQQRLNKGFPFL